MASGFSLSGTNHDRTDAEQDAWIEEDRRKRNKMDDSQISHGFRTNRGQVDLLGGNSDAVAAARDGRKSFTANGGQDYVFNPDTGRWVSHTNSNDYYVINPVDQGSSGGGGGGESPQPELISGVTGDAGAVATPGVTTEQVLGSQNYNSMNNFAPTSHTMGNDGQTQHLNPLVAAQNWMHQLQPQPTYNQGLYINPGVGLLEDEQQNSIWGIV